MKIGDTVLVMFGNGSGGILTELTKSKVRSFSRLAAAIEIEVPVTNNGRDGYTTEGQFRTLWVKAGSIVDVVD